MLAWIIVAVLVFLLLYFVLHYRMKYLATIRELELERQMLGHHKETFQSIASEVLDKNNERFLQMAAERLEKKNMEASFQFEKKSKDFEQMLSPMRELMEKMQQDLRSVEKQRVEQFGHLKESLGQMRDLNEKLRLETTTLSNALKRPEVRGSWGEIQLRRVVELAGMSAYCDFQEQVSQKGEGRLHRPDMVVHMPSGRSIIIDAKAVMDAFLEAMEAKSSEARKAALGKHAQNMRARVRELAKKSYWEQFDKSPEFVVLFVPNEALLAAAVEVDRALIEDALEASIIIATPTNLVSLLKAIAYGWQQEKVQENAKKIVEAAKEFYQRLSPWLKKMEDVGQKMDGAVKSYNESMGSLESRVLPQVRRMREMAFPDKEDLPTPKQIDKVPRT
tara:strand:+ start:266 stop:1438 length:1173 start_codon:yes stop_codon:yes gene_type:complete